MAKIHLVRHGEAEAGFGTHSDPGLSEHGWQQAERVAQRLVDLGPLPILSSPLARAQQTAQPLAKLWDVQILIEPRVAEIPSPTTDLSQRAAWLSQAMQGTWGALPNELIQWRDALGHCLSELTSDCIVFSHYVAINAAVGVAQNDDRMRIFGPDNCSITTLDNSAGNMTVIRLGDSAETKVN